MELRVLPRKEYEKAIALWQYCFQDPEPFTRWYFDKRAGDVLALGDGKLAAMAVTVPVRFSIRGEARTGRMVSGVATAPEYRGRGFMRAFMAQSHSFMADRGVSIGGLYPFDYAFYEKFGWAACGDMLKVNVPLRRLPSIKMCGEFSLLSKLPSLEEAFAQVYAQCFGKYSGHVIRDAASFAQRLEEHALDGGYAALYRRAGVPEGYLLYRFEGKTLVIEEYGAHTHPARMDTLAFIAGHSSTAEDATWKSPPDDPLWRLIPDGRGVATLEPHSMLRILDIPAALKNLPAGDGEICLDISDASAPRNDGAWTIKGTGGRLYAEKASGPADGSLTIGQLTQWALGYRSARNLRDLGCNIPQSIVERMDELLPPCPAFLFEAY